jgi:hypothetical protein
MRIKCAEPTFENSFSAISELVPKEGKKTDKTVVFAFFALSTGTNYEKPPSPLIKNALKPEEYFLTQSQNK